MPSDNTFEAYERVCVEAPAAGLRAVRDLVAFWIEKNPHLAGTDPFTTDYIPGEWCGCGYVTVSGNTKFGRWALKHKKWFKDYPTGVTHGIEGYPQMGARQTAYARSYSEVLCKAGVE